MKILLVTLTYFFAMFTASFSPESISTNNSSDIEKAQIVVEAFLNDGTSEFFYFTAKDDIKCELEKICVREDFTGRCTACYIAGEEYCCVTGNCDNIDELLERFCGGFTPTPINEN